MSATIIRYKEDSNTRYLFDEEESISMLYKDDTEIGPFVEELNPRAIFVSGWGDKEYRKVAKKYRNTKPVIVGIDNPWISGNRQWLLCVISPWYIHKIFNAAWVPGTRQMEYARRLGFPDDRIINHLYSANTEKFYKESGSMFEAKKNKYPHTIVFLGRMVEYKQPHILATVFSKLINEYQFDWKLILAGEGPLKEVICNKNYTQVEVIDFVAPDHIPKFYLQAGIFCLPSKGEHWGVAVHEAAAAGLPLLLSDSVHSGTEFLIKGENGFAFETGNEKSLKRFLLQMMKMTDDELWTMGNKSIAASKRISQDTWSASLNSMLKNQTAPIELHG